MQLIIHALLPQIQICNPSLSSIALNNIPMPVKLLFTRLPPSLSFKERGQGVRSPFHKEWDQEVNSSIPKKEYLGVEISIPPIQNPLFFTFFIIPILLFPLWFIDIVQRNEKPLSYEKSEHAFYPRIHRYAARRNFSSVYGKTFFCFLHRYAACSLGLARGSDNRIEKIQYRIVLKNSLLKTFSYLIPS